MFNNETTKKAEELLSNIDSLYMSDKFFELISQSSCDCDEIVIRNGDDCILLTSHPLGEDGYLKFDLLSNYDEDRFIYEVDMGSEHYRFDKFCFLDNELIEGIRFRSGNIFLFVFALEHNLVLTKSKYDIFEELETDLPDIEETLRIIRNKNNGTKNHV